ncbi:glucose-6-phosphate dehydrogenase [Mycobacterium sp. LTG2003]
MNDHAGQHNVDFFGALFETYFRPTIDEYPGTGAALIHRLMTSTDDIQDRLAQARHAALAWSEGEPGYTGMTSELFVITQCGLMYAACFGDARHPHYYLATPDRLFDPFVDQVEGVRLQPGEVVAVDRRCSHDLAAAHPMDAALRRILDEHEALRVNVSG